MGVLTLDRQAIGRRGQLVGALTAGEGDELMTITANGIVTRQLVADIRQTGRATQGVIVQKVRDEDDRIAAVAIVRDPGGDVVDAGVTPSPDALAPDAPGTP